MSLLMPPNPISSQVDNSGAVTAEPPSPTLDNPRAQKLRNSTQEFESFLVTSWWEKMEQTFGDTQTHPAGFDTLNNMGLHAMTLAMAKAGGLGIARMLYHKLEPALKNDPVPVPQDH